MAVPELAPGDLPGEIFADVLQIYSDAHPGADTTTLKRAYELAARLHGGQTRQTGDPYITHPLTVTKILAEYGMDAETLAAALLHDVVEDTEITIENIAADFGDEVASLIDGVTKMDRIKFSSREEQQAATIRKMAIAMAKDIRVLLIKLADRLHNIRTLDPLPEDKQVRVARETLDVYAPLAHRLGVQEIKHEMEEACFGVLYPRRKAEIEDLVRARTPEREQYLTDVMSEVNRLLSGSGITATVTGRPKHLYSIYRKMVESGLAFEQIFDLMGIRILVENARDCYAALGLVHTMWAPIHGRFKDYIATPKFNLYQSLHTTVVGPGGKALEVQIRSFEMHERAEHGIAAHWSYKEGVHPSEIDFMKDLRALQEATENPSEFLAHLKLDLYQDEVFVLTPRGKVVTLPMGATPVDFAYRIHTDVGHRCIGAKVNNRLVTLATPLESGDIVEIITSKASEAHPSRDWLEFVKSGRAASKIRQWYSKQRREQALHEGKEALTKALRKEKLVSAPGREQALQSVSEEMGFDDTDTLHIAIGDGRITAGTIAARAARILNPEVDEVDEDLLTPPPRPAHRRPSRGIIVEGMDDMLVRIARCCAPVPGDPIVGFVTVGRGVSVHRADCANVGALEERSERMIEVSWAADQTGSFFVWLQVEALDRPKLLRDVTAALSDFGANIHASSSATGRDRVAVLRYEVELSDPALLDVVLDELKAVDAVFDAYRLVPQTN